MAAFPAIDRTVLLGTAWTGTAPGVGVAVGTIAGTITTPSNITPFLRAGAEPTWSANMVDFNNMGALGFSVVLPGITSGDDLVCDCNSDWAASQLGPIVRTTLGGIARPNTSPIFVDVKPTSAARSVTNPSFVAACFIKQWMPYGGSVGERTPGRLVLAITGSFTDLTS